MSRIQVEMVLFTLSTITLMVALSIFKGMGDLEVLPQRNNALANTVGIQKPETFENKILPVWF